MSATVTPLEALRRLIEACKLIDFADCKDERVWNQLGGELGVAEGVVRDQPLTDAELDALIYPPRAQLKPEDWDSTTKQPRKTAPVAAHPSEAAQPVPEGWKFVPIEPTDAMLTEVDEEVGGSCYSCSKWNASWDDCRRVYAAMLSAAPTAAVSAAPSGELLVAADRMRKAHVAAKIPAKLPAHAEALEYQCAVQALISAATKE